MESRISIEDFFEGLDNTIVYKSKPSIFLSILLVVSGIAFIAVNGKIVDSPNSLISPLFIVIGICLLAWGVVSIFFRKAKYKSAATKQNISFSELFFDIKERDKLIRILKEGNASELLKLKTSANDALKLRVAATQDGSLCYTQVVTYIPFEFVNANAPHAHTPEEAKVILELVKNKK